MNNDFGASHDFGKAHGKSELRVSRTLYMKEKHLRYAAEMAEKEEINISEAVDRMLQCGLAWIEKDKFQQTLKDVKV